MGYPTKVQLIKRAKSEQWYINFPAAIARAMEFSKGEVVEWYIDDKKTLVLHRPNAPGPRVKKKTLDRPSSEKSGRSLKSAAEPSGKSVTGGGDSDSS